MTHSHTTKGPTGIEQYNYSTVEKKNGIIEKNGNEERTNKSKKKYNK